MLALELMHEIRNPVEALGYLTYLGNEEADNPDGVREYMRLAGEQMSTVSRIINQTLGFARAAQVSEPIQLGSVAEAALRIHGRTLETKKVRLIKDLRDDAIAPVVRGEMLQVISSLVVNAVDALSGLGLALSKRVIDGYRGRIRVRSRVCPGRSGTIFRISFPVEPMKKAS
jgi:signal transduction histidine kinase